MNYLDITNAVFERRFPSTSPVEDWVRAAYADIWQSSDWTFKHVFQEQWYTSTDGTSGGAATAQPKMPAVFAQVENLYDQNGCELQWFSPDDFAAAYTPAVSGQPESFTVVNRQIILGPTPAGAYPFLISYRRRLCSRDSSGAVKNGFMSQNEDQPLWDDHHYLIVLRAKMIGLRDRSDPTADDLQGEYSGLLEAMRAEYTLESPPGLQLPAWRC